MIIVNVKQPYSIDKVGEEDKSRVIDFMMSIRSEVFPMLSQDQLPPDLLHFRQHYIQQENATVLAARMPDGTLIGTIGIIPYDGRFHQLEGFYNNIPTAEIVKCYIDSTYRRLKIGTTLFQEALKFSEDAGYQKLYLHTHPFLPGAISFWENQGFAIRLAEDDPIWKTVHMDMNLKCEMKNKGSYISENE